MDSRAGFRLLVVDEGAPVTPLHAGDYLERLPWLTDCEQRPAKTRNASPLSLWPVTGAVLVALVSYFAAQASFAQPEQGQGPGQGQGQLTVMLPAATPYRADRLINLNEEASRRTEAEYLAHVAYELEQLKNSDPFHAGASKTPGVK